ncbi:MAG: type II toxin-antitoxin system VapC family toxin [Candidatus Baltobacteraceae bacterium]
MDASVVLSWFLDDELDEFANTSAARVVSEGALVPAIFPAEVANALVNAARRGRLTNTDVTERLTRLDALPIMVDSARVALGEEVDLAQKHKLTIYDAMYLHIALRQQWTLLTRDADLRRAALKENILIQ